MEYGIFPVGGKCPMQFRQNAWSRRTFVLRMPQCPEILNPNFRQLNLGFKKRRILGETINNQLNINSNKGLNSILTDVI